MTDTATKQAQSGQVQPEQKPVDKYPTLTPIVKKLEQERDAIQKKAEPYRNQREELLRQIQPLEVKLRKVDEKIKEIERPRLPEINNELGALAKAMGGRSMNENNENASKDSEEGQKDQE